MTLGNKPRRRVAITGVGIISSLGHQFAAVSDSLRAGRSGIRFAPAWKETGLNSHIAGDLGDVEALVEAAGFKKSRLRCMNDAAQYCTLAARDAIDDAAFDNWPEIREQTSCIVGTGLSGLSVMYANAVRFYKGEISRIDPYTVVRTMGSSSSASIANTFGLNGRSYSISSACATSSHNIGHAYEMIRDGNMDFALAGGGEEINPLIGSAFNAMRTVLSTKYNDQPERASRPYDRQRDGIVMTGGAGMVMLEPLDHAQARGAKIYGEILGYGATSDGFDMILPEPEGKQAALCMRTALQDAALPPDAVQYINAHATGTVAGDLAEMHGIRTLFKDRLPMISSTKSIGGHAIGAAGVHELIHCLAMLQQGFVAPSINIEEIDPAFADVPIVRETTASDLRVVMSNNFGFGGTNACFVLGKIA